MKLEVSCKNLEVEVECCKMLFENVVDNDGRR